MPAKCQRGFGWCDSEHQPKGYNTSEDARPVVGEVPYGQLITKCTVPRTIALTYDDGPTDNSGEILDILKEHQAKATFFVNGITDGKGPLDETEKWKKVVQRMHDEGHQVASHTWSHRDLNKISTLDRKVEMVKLEQALDNILDMYPTYMRPPYLQCSTDTGCQKDIGDLGYHLIGWSTDSTDWLHEGDLDAMTQATEAAIDGTDPSGNMLLIQHDSIQLSAINLTRHILQRTAEKGWHGEFRCPCESACIADLTVYQQFQWASALETIPTTGTANQTGRRQMPTQTQAQTKTLTHQNLSVLNIPLRLQE